MQVFIHNDFRVRKLGFIGELPWWCNGPMTAELGVRGPAPWALLRRLSGRYNHFMLDFLRGSLMLFVKNLRLASFGHPHNMLLFALNDRFLGALSPSGSRDGMSLAKRGVSW